MNGLRDARAELEAVIRGLEIEASASCEVVICPPATLIADLADLARGSAIRIGAQDCHPQPHGAHTGEISAEMLKDCGAELVICGHSERRSEQGESNALVRAKAEAARRAGLESIVCVGESKAERQSGETLAALSRQVKASVPRSGDSLFSISYEPIWAIGSGEAARPEDIEQAHRHIADLLSKICGANHEVAVLYGGSVKPENAAQIASIASVNGLLIGGASLKAASFLSIIDLCKRYC